MFVRLRGIHQETRSSRSKQYSLGSWFNLLAITSPDVPFFAHGPLVTCPQKFTRHTHTITWVRKGYILCVYIHTYMAVRHHFESDMYSADYVSQLFWSTLQLFALISHLLVYKISFTGVDIYIFYKRQRKYSCVFSRKQKCEKDVFYYKSFFQLDDCEILFFWEKR